MKEPYKQYKQYKYKEFTRILEDMLKKPQCFSPSGIRTLENILHINYPEKEDDIEYLTDMVNYYIRSHHLVYSRGQRAMFLHMLSRYINHIIADGSFYIDEVIRQRENAI